MDSKSAFLQMMKDNAEKAGYRIASTQLVNATRGAIVAVLRKQGADSGKLASAEAFFQSEFGVIFISMLLGMGLDRIPKYGDDPRVARIAEEFRIGGMAVAGNMFMDEITKTVLPALGDVFSALPAEAAEEQKIRLAEPKPPAVEEAEDEEEELAEVKTKHA